MKRKLMMALLACMLGGMMAESSYAQSIAEKLGYPADAKLLIIHADDIGMCHSANVSAIDALEKGIVTSGSIMVPCPWFMEIAAYARENPEVDLGLHLTLTSEWKLYRWRPITPANLVKGLLDADGYMHRGVRAVAERATPREIEHELRAQIEHALASGVRPTHMDSHMGTIYTRSDYVKVALKLAEEYDIPFMYFNPTPQMLEIAEGRYDYDIHKDLMNQGIPMLDALFSISNTPVEEAEAFYQNVISNLKPGLSELILHLAKEGDEIRAITGSHRQRVEDYRIFTSPEMREFIQEQEVHLIGWKDLLPLWKNRQRETM